MTVACQLVHSNVFAGEKAVQYADETQIDFEEVKVEGESAKPSVVLVTSAIPNTERCSEYIVVRGTKGAIELSKAQYLACMSGDEIPSQAGAPRQQTGYVQYTGGIDGLAWAGDNPTGYRPFYGIGIDTTYGTKGVQVHNRSTTQGGKYGDEFIEYEFNVTGYSVPFPDEYQIGKNGNGLNGALGYGEGGATVWIEPSQMHGIVIGGQVQIEDVANVFTGGVGKVTEISEDTATVVALQVGVIDDPITGEPHSVVGFREDFDRTGEHVTGFANVGLLLGQDTALLNIESDLHLTLPMPQVAQNSALKPYVGVNGELTVADTGPAWDAHEKYEGGLSVGAAW